MDLRFQPRAGETPEGLQPRGSAKRAWRPDFPLIGFMMRFLRVATAYHASAPTERVLENDPQKNVQYDTN